MLSLRVDSDAIGGFQRVLGSSRTSRPPARSRRPSTARGRAGGGWSGSGSPRCRKERPTATGDRTGCSRAAGGRAGGGSRGSGTRQDSSFPCSGSETRMIGCSGWLGRASPSRRTGRRVEDGEAGGSRSAGNPEGAVVMTGARRIETTASTSRVVVRPLLDPPIRPAGNASGERGNH